MPASSAIGRGAPHTSGLGSDPKNGGSLKLRRRTWAEDIRRAPIPKRRYRGGNLGKPAAGQEILGDRALHALEERLRHGKRVLVIGRSRIMMMAVHEQLDDTGLVVPRLTVVVPGEVHQEGRAKHPRVCERENRENRPTPSSARTHGGSLDDGTFFDQGEPQLPGVEGGFTGRDPKKSRRFARFSVLSLAMLRVVRKRGNLALGAEGAVGGGGDFTTVGGVGSAFSHLSSHISSLRMCLQRRQS